MPTPQRIPLGPFKGLNTWKAPHLLDGGEAVSALNVDTTAGTLRGFYQPSATPAGSVTPPTNYYISDLWYSSAGAFRVSPGKPNACGPDDNGATYYIETDITQPHVWQLKADIYGSTAVLLGVPGLGLGGSPNVPTAANGTSGGSRSYAVTVVTSHGWESNPTNLGAIEGPPALARLNVTKNIGTVITMPAWDTVYAPYTTYPAAGLTLNLYATQINDPDGAMFLHTAGVALSGTVTDNDAIAADGSTATGLNLEIPLNWAAGGYGGLPQADHSMPPSTLQITSRAMHSALGAGGAGMLFVANYRTVYWSSTGEPWYFPTANSVPLPENVQALNAGVGVTYALTAGGIYEFTGSDDASIDCRRTAAGIGSLMMPLADTGAPFSMSPYGFLYPARQGLALYNGSMSRVISEGILDPIMLTGFGRNGPQSYPVPGAFFGRRFYLINNTGTPQNAPGTTLPWLPAWGCMVFDFDASNPYFPTVRSAMYTNFSLTNDPTGEVIGCTVTPHGANGAPAFYLLGHSGSVYLWDPDLGDLLSSRSGWTWKTGALTADIPTRRKVFTSATLEGVGQITITAYADPAGGAYDESTPLWTQTVTLPMPGNPIVRFPLTQARQLYLKFAGAAGAEIRAAHVDCEVNDGL